MLFSLIKCQTLEDRSLEVVRLLDQFLLGHSSRYCDISCSNTVNLEPAFNVDGG